jgi:hypothetical protein
MYVYVAYVLNESLQFIYELISPLFHLNCALSRFVIVFTAL